MKKLVFIVCLLTAIDVLGQMPKFIEADLLKSFNKIEYWEEKQYNVPDEINGPDSLARANDVFSAKLKKYIALYPSTFDLKFSTIRPLKICMSEDRMLKTYCWDDGTGGTMRYYNCIAQYKDNGKFFSTQLGKTFITNVFTVKANGKTYYLATFIGQAWSGYYISGINVWTISNGKVNRKVKLFKTQTGIKNEISYSYYIHEKFDGDIKYDSQTKTLSIPLVIKKEQLSGRYITYKFTGQYFEKLK